MSFLLTDENRPEETVSGNNEDNQVCNMFVSNISASPAYGFYISQLICYSRACAWYSDFLTELSCWRTKYPSKTTLLLGKSHRYKNYTVVIIIWLTATQYPYLKWQWIFYFLRRCFLSSITAKTFTGLECIGLSRSSLLHFKQKRTIYTRKVNS